MKINARNVVVAFLVIMSLTSYVFLSNIEVSEPTPLDRTELDAQYEAEAHVALPDLTLIQRIIETATRALTL